MLSDAEIVRRLRAIRLSPASERYARRAPSMNGIAVAAGINRVHVHDIASGKARLGRRSRECLSRALTELVVGQAGPDAKPVPPSTAPNQPI